MQISSFYSIIFTNNTQNTLKPSAVQTIDRVMKMEKEFFLPYISGNLGNCAKKGDELSASLEKFKPTAEVMTNQW